MQIFRSYNISLYLIVLLYSQSVSAFDYFISGFGTASLSCFTNDDADYVINDQPEGPGRSRKCDGGTDSLLGLQLDLILTDSLEIGVQAIADRNEDRDYLPDLIVAQLRWHVSDNLTLRLGRMPTPAFLHSENRQVRYAMPWVRPPLEVYGIVPTFSNEAIEFLYNDQYGNWRSEWHGGITYLNFDTPISNSHDTSPVESYGGFLNVTLENMATLFKISYVYNEIGFTTPDVNALFEILRSPLVEQGGQVAESLSIDHSPLHLFAFGLKHEADDWLIMSEFSFRTMKGFFRDQIGSYLTLGHRFNDWLPFISVARRWTSGPKTDSRAGILQPAVEALLASSRFDNTTLSFGFSHDIHEQVKVKLQTDWVVPDKNSWGLQTNHAPSYNFSDPSSDWLFTLSVDFVF